MSTHRKAYLEITNCCNLRCSFCAGTSRAPHTMTEAEFTALADKLHPWAEFLLYHLMGEPTAHPLLPRFINIATAMGFKSIITTNGTLLPSRGDELIAAKPHKVSISLHAFEANPPGMSFEGYINGCLEFAKKAADKDIFVILRLWNLDGRAEGALNEKNDQILKMLEERFPKPWLEIRTGAKLRSHVFLEWGEKFDWPDLNGKIQQENGFCYGLRNQVAVLCDGTVVPCCLDRNGDLALGNLFTDSLENILASDRARNLYEGFSSRKCTEELCRRCMRASYY